MVDNTIPSHVAFSSQLSVSPNKMESFEDYVAELSQMSIGFQKAASSQSKVNIDIEG